MDFTRWIRTVCLVFLVFSYSPAEASLPDLVKGIQPAVVKIITYGLNKDVTGVGSGFFIDREGQLITNFHVLQGAFSAEVVTYEGDKYPIKMILAEDQYSDLLKVSVEMPKPPKTLLRLAEDLPAIAEQVLVVGSPLGLEQSVSEGIVSAVRELPGIGKFFQTTAPISPGSSGSPVINLKGNVVGVISFQSVMGQNLNFAIATQKITQLLDRHPPQSLAEWTYALSNEKSQLAAEMCRKGFRFSINGELKKALSYFEDAAREDPKNTMAWFGLGQCYIGLDQPEHVVDTFKAAIQINIDDAALHYNLGNYYAKQGQLKEAVDSYKEAVRINPDAVLVHNKLGLTYDKLGLFQDAIDSHREVIRINPGSANSHYNIGVAFRKLGAIDQAINSFRGAVRIDPDFSGAHKNIGILSILLGNPEDGLTALKQAIRIDPDDAVSHYHLGEAFLKTGDKDAALQEYKILKRLDSGAAEKLFNKLYL